jgi:hypothetical protein
MYQQCKDNFIVPGRPSPSLPLFAAVGRLSSGESHVHTGSCDPMLIGPNAMWLFSIDYLNTMPQKPIGLFSPWEAEANTQKQSARHINDVISYCASRFRSALGVVVQETDEKGDWMQENFLLELV